MWVYLRLLQAATAGREALKEKRAKALLGPAEGSRPKEGELGGALGRVGRGSA